MKTITFYSYKGGVGRTLTAVNFAVYLAKLGQRIVLIDFDLEAPGSDSKFPDIPLPKNQKGLLDYILAYQDTKSDPGSIEQICIKVPIGSEKDTSLCLIPSGDYTSQEYYRNLSKLNWDKIFSGEYRGIEFFQNFLGRIEKELKPDTVIIDSRTGIGEIAGLCTQQLADEVVMFSSMSGESIKMTKHIKQLIIQSKIADALGKSIDVKIVVSRVPKPDDLDMYKKYCCELFDIDETKLFFLFSCPALEQEEFLAVSAVDRSEELVSNYVRLFYGLNVKLASEGIQNAIKQIDNLLSTPSTLLKEKEKNILELTALYQHPEVYRSAMRFYYLTKDYEKTIEFGMKLLDLTPDDDEVQRILADIYMAYYKSFQYFDPEKAIPILRSLWQKKELKTEEALQLATLLESEGQYNESFDVAFALSNEEQLDKKILVELHQIIIRNSLKIGKSDIAIEFAKRIPEEELSSETAGLLLEFYEEEGNSELAFEMAKRLIQKRFDKRILEQASRIARNLGRLDELEELIVSSDKIQRYIKRSFPRTLINDLITDIKNLGFNKAANALQQIHREASDK